MKLLGLPNEIWIKILSNLKQKELINASLISKKVKELALDPVLWTNLELSDFRIHHVRGNTFNLEICVKDAIHQIVLIKFCILSESVVDA
jgi:hypothetical protein